MRLTALLVLAVLTGALVCAHDPEAASAPGSGNSSHESSAVTQENGESSGLDKKTPKPSRKQRSSPPDGDKEEIKKVTGELEHKASGLLDHLKQKVGAVWDAVEDVTKRLTLTKDLGLKKR
ncbi:dermcidin [Nycticebus coucang]|uniref:dermcidin n=1 Tax=Nycticebus coucang TaxID=9470 RepID=UPI00234CD11B|nr:dermcidin [Nycticebus coucang]